MVFLHKYKNDAFKENEKGLTVIGIGIIDFIVFTIRLVGVLAQFLFQIGPILPYLFAANVLSWLVLGVVQTGLMIGATASN